MAQRDLISNVIAFEFVTKCDGFEFDAHSIHHRNDGTHLEYEGRQHRAEFVNGQRVVTVEHHVTTPISNSNDKQLDLKIAGRLPLGKHLKYALLRILIFDR